METKGTLPRHLERARLAHHLVQHLGRLWGIARAAARVVRMHASEYRAAQAGRRPARHVDECKLFEAPDGLLGPCVEQPRVVDEDRPIELGIDLRVVVAKFSMRRDGRRRAAEDAAAEDAAAERAGARTRAAPQEGEALTSRVAQTSTAVAVRGRSRRGEHLHAVRGRSRRRAPVRRCAVVAAGGGAGVAAHAVGGGVRVTPATEAASSCLLVTAATGVGIRPPLRIRRLHA